jgi:hypothetical protein
MQVILVSICTGSRQVAAANLASREHLIKCPLPFSVLGMRILWSMFLKLWSAPFPQEKSLQKLYQTLNDEKYTHARLC